jgi:hypothetical protein
VSLICNVSASRKVGFLVPVGLLVLSLVPGIAGTSRLVQLAHGAEIRAYALGLGAGTQAFTHFPWFLFPSVHGELARTLCMAAGWAINAAVAEWVIFRMSRDKPARGPNAHSAALPRNPGVVVPS